MVDFTCGQLLPGQGVLGNFPDNELPAQNDEPGGGPPPYTPILPPGGGPGGEVFKQPGGGGGGGGGVGGHTGAIPDCQCRVVGLVDGLTLIHDDEEPPLLWHCMVHPDDPPFSECIEGDHGYATKAECEAQAEEDCGYPVPDPEEFIYCVEIGSCGDPGLSPCPGQTPYPNTDQGMADCIANSFTECLNWHCISETECEQSTATQDYQCEIDCLAAAPRECAEEPPDECEDGEQEFVFRQKCINVAPHAGGDPGNNAVWQNTIDEQNAAHGEEHVDVDPEGALNAACKPAPTTTDCCQDGIGGAALMGDGVVKCCPDVRIVVCEGAEPPLLFGQPFQAPLPPPPSTPKGVGSALINKGLGKLAGLASKLLPELPFLGPVINTNSQGNQTVNLNDLEIKQYVLANSPTGLIDPRLKVAPNFADVNATFINNTRKNDAIFARKIHPTIAYLRELADSPYKDWDSQPIYGLNHDTLIRSLNPKFLRSLSEIKFFDGTPLHPRQIADIIRSRLIEGTLDDINLLPYGSLAKQPQESIRIIPSNDPTVNLVAALNVLENHKIPLDPSKSTGRQREVSKLTRTLATDLNKALIVTIGGSKVKFFIGDDNIVANRTNITVQPGDYVNLTIGATIQKIFLDTEIDHAYILDPRYLQQVEKLLGGDGSKTLTVSALYSDKLEFNYSLNEDGESPWEEFYFAKLIPSSVDGIPSPTSPYLTETTARYEIVDHTTTEGLNSINELIKYTANYAFQSIDHDDVILNYITSTGKFDVTRKDFLDDSPKMNKEKPLIARAVPWYYIIFPTNREEYLTFGTKSHIRALDNNIIFRSLQTLPMLNREAAKPTTKNIINMELTFDHDQPDVYGGFGDIQSRMVVLNVDSPTFSKGYKPGLGTEVEPPRTKTAFRIVKEIIQDLNNKYIFERSGVGAGLNNSDVYFRMTGGEYNRAMMLENFVYLWPKIRAGLIDNINIFPSSKGSGPSQLTRILARRLTWSQELFPPLKSMNIGDIFDPMGGFILPPTTVEPYSSIVGTHDPTSVPRAAKSRR